MLKNEFILLKVGDKVIISLRGKFEKGSVMKKDEEAKMVYVKVNNLSRVIRRHFRTVYKEFI